MAAITLSVETIGHSTLALVHSVERGLPVALVDEVARSVAPDDALFRYSLVPRSTLARKRGGASPRLTVQQGDKVVRLMRLWASARSVWKSADAARGFLHRPHPLLDGATPLRVALASAAGARLVEDILGRLEHGTGV